MEQTSLLQFRIDLLNISQLLVILDLITLPFQPKSIHAVTAKGFEVKVALFVLACNLNFLW
jgi:hypothetical protein